MPQKKVVNCKVCGRHVSECGPLSARKKCAECGERLASEAIVSMSNREGDAYEKWAAGQARFAMNLNRGRGGTTPPSSEAPQSDAKSP